MKTNSPSKETLIELNEAILRLGRAFAHRKSVCNVEGTPHNSLSEAHLMLLRQLAATPGMRQREIAEYLGVKPPAITGLIDHLEQVSIVERVSDPNDRRVSLVQLSDKGREIMEQQTDTRYELLTRMTEGMTYEEVEILTRACTKLLGTIERIEF